MNDCRSGSVLTLNDVGKICRYEFTTNYKPIYGKCSILDESDSYRYPDSNHWLAYLSIGLHDT